MSPGSRIGQTGVFTAIVEELSRLADSAESTRVHEKRRDSPLFWTRFGHSFRGPIFGLGTRWPLLPIRAGLPARSRPRSHHRTQARGSKSEHVARGTWQFRQHVAHQRQRRSRVQRTWPSVADPFRSVARKSRLPVLVGVPAQICYAQRR